LVAASSLNKTDFLWRLLGNHDLEMVKGKMLEAI